MSLPISQLIQELEYCISLLKQSGNQELTHIERDILKRRLSKVYEQLSGYTTTVEERVQEVVALENVNQEQEEVHHQIAVIESKESETERISVETPQPQESVIQVESLSEPIVIEEKNDTIIEKKPEHIQEQEPMLQANLQDETKKSLNEKFTTEKSTLADKISKPLGMLKNNIDVNEKFFFIKELFQQNGAAYDQAIRFLDNLTSYSEAMIYIERELAINHKWEKESKARDKFMKHINSRFGR